MKITHPRVTTVGLAAGLILAALLTYRGTLSLPLGSDARFLTYQNEFMQDPGGLARVWTADFFEGAVTHGVPYRSGYYRPVTNAMFWLEYRLAGTRDVVYHLFQVLLHGVNAFLAFALCRRLGGDRLAAALAGAAFALHPIHAFAVSEPAARADVLFATFYVLGILSFDSAIRDRGGVARAAKVALTVLLYGLAVLSKEMGITLPAVLVALVLYRRATDGVPLRRGLWSLPVWGALAAYLGWRFGVIHLAPPTVGYGDAHSTPALLVGGLKGIVVQLSRIVVPLGADYPELNPWLVNFLDRPLADPLTYVALVVVASLGLMALAWRWNALLAFWSAFFLITYSPLLRVDNIAGSLGHNVILTQERWIYLPFVAVAAVAGRAVARLWRTRTAGVPRAAVAVAATAVLAFMGFSAAAHAGRHEDPYARLRALYLLPEERLSPMQRANKLMLYAQWVALPMGDTLEARRRASEALELVPDSPIAAAAMAQVLNATGGWAETVEILSPWLSPTVDELEAYRETNARVGDDLNRTSGLIAIQLARAVVHLDDGPRTMGLLCESVRREAPVNVVAETLRQAYGLYGPPGCADAADAASCVAPVTLPNAAAWTPPFDGTSCGIWEEAVRE